MALELCVRLSKLTKTLTNLCNNELIQQHFLSLDGLSFNQIKFTESKVIA